MKKFLPYILILVLLIGFFTPIAHVHASVQGAVTPAPTPAGSTSPSPAPPKGFICWATGYCISDIISSAVAWFSYLLLTLVGLLLYYSGILLNFIIGYTVVDLKIHIGGLDGINTAWKVIRDLMNILFIFMLVYEGIKLIIGQSSTQNIKKFITYLVIASLLINFSLFFTKVMIDASNIVTIGFYNAMASKNAAGQDIGLSDQITSSLGLTSIYDKDAVKNFAAGAGSDWKNMLVIGLGGSILFFVTACIFFTVSMLFIIRFITLIVLMMLSPIGYMGYVLPFMKTYSNQWWESLRGQLLFGPIYMILMWAIMTLLRSKGFITTTGGYADLLKTGMDAPAPQTVSIILDFIVIIGLMVTAVIISKTTAKSGSSLIADATGKLTEFAGGVVVGGTAAVGRKYIGGRALKGTTEEELEARAAEGSRTAKVRLALAKGSYDMRRSAIGEQTAKITQTNFGKGLPFNEKAGQGGQAARVAEKKKDTEGDWDKVMKNYVDKRDWTGLATAVRDKPALTSTSEWEKQQKYVYKKLSRRDRISLDTALGNPTLTATLRTKLPLDEQIQMYTDNKDWVNMVNFVKIADPNTGTARSLQEQQYIYEKMSARDRVAFDNELNDKALTTDLRKALTVEEQEKTEKTVGEVAVASASAKTRGYIRDMVAGTPPAIDPTTGAPYYASIKDAVAALKPSDARKLNHDARMKDEVAENLTIRHLGDLMSNGDLTDDEVRFIRSKIVAGSPQEAWVDDPVRSKDWNI